MNDKVFKIEFYLQDGTERIERDLKSDTNILMVSRTDV